MDGFGVTDKRYIAVVALIYLVALSATDFASGGVSALSLKFLLPRCLLFPLLAVVMAVLGTLVPIARFGSARGSRYFTPTIPHATILILLIADALKMVKE